MRLRLLLPQYLVIEAISKNPFVPFKEILPLYFGIRARLQAAGKSIKNLPPF